MDYVFTVLAFISILHVNNADDTYSDYEEVESYGTNNKSRRNIVDLLSYTNRHRLLVGAEIIPPTTSIAKCELLYTTKQTDINIKHPEFSKLQWPKTQNSIENANDENSNITIDVLNQMTTAKLDKPKSPTQSYIEFYYLDETGIQQDHLKTRYFHDLKNNVPKYDFTSNITNHTEISTAYDKVRFFEMYDKETEEPIILNNTLKEGHSSNHGQQSESNLTNNITTESMFNLSLNKSIIESDSYLQESKTLVEISHNFTDGYKVEEQFNQTLAYTPETYRKYSVRASWFDYPYAAVYIYEQLQVHCDAAGISRHWLVSSGACLARHRIGTHAEGPSAFVTYCGPYWQYPERITYVKYTIIHPKFNPRDKMRRQLYNIALIQVVGSMEASCKGWSPASLVTHKHTTSSEGSVGTAVGWGVDRYGTKYKSSDLPQRPMMAYDAVVYSDYCPGINNIGKRSNLLELSYENLLCLSLPPYHGEEKDPVHGGLLLLGGKLIGLYLQEVRRTSGDQSAQYTGIWDLIPWVVETASELDEHDLLFYAEI